MDETQKPVVHNTPDTNLIRLVSQAIDAQRRDGINRVVIIEMLERMNRTASYEAALDIISEYVRFEEGE